MPRNAPKVVLEASRFPGPQKVSAPDAFFEPFGDTCAILAAILRPAGRQRGPQIEHFGIKSHQSLKKLRPEWGIRKSMRFWLNFDGKTCDFECAEPTEMFI